MFRRHKIAGALYLIACVVFAGGLASGGTTLPGNATAIRNKLVAAAAPTDGQVLAFVASTGMWTPSAAGAGDITAVVAGTGLSGGATSGSATLAIDTATTVDKTTAQTLANKTLTTPTIGSFTNAAHDHTNAAGGGSLGSNSVGATQLSRSSCRIFFIVARNGAGNFTATGVKANDEIAQVINLGGGPGAGTNVTSSFTALAPADNTLTQSAATDFSTAGLLFFIVAKGG